MRFSDATVDELKTLMDALSQYLDNAECDEWSGIPLPIPTAASMLDEVESRLFEAIGVCDGNVLCVDEASRVEHESSRCGNG